jgi:uncharacterized membrane protein YkoI
VHDGRDDGDDEEATMQKRTKVVIATAVGLAAIGAGAGVAVAGGEDESEGPDVPITGADLDRASTAALEHTGEGRVTDTEVGDEESYYEVEVTLDDGTQVDVQLDEDFDVVGDEADGAEDDEDDD